MNIFKLIFLFILSVVFFSSCAYLQGPAGKDGEPALEASVYNLKINGKNGTFTRYAGNIDLTWEAVPAGKAKSYDIDVNGDGNPEFTGIINNFYSTYLVTGTYAVRVRAINTDNQAGPWSVAINLTISYSVVTNIKVLGNLTPYASNSASPLFFSWQVITDTTISTYQIDTNGDGVADYTSPSIGYNLPVLAEAAYSVRIRAVDSASNIGNWSVPFVLTWDRTPPGTPSLISFTPVAALQGAVQWSAVADALTYVSNYRISLDFGGNLAVIQVNMDFAGNITGVAVISDPSSLVNSLSVGAAVSPYQVNITVNSAGSYSVKILAMDAAGNSSPFSSVLTNGL